ncbi:MAG TPA: hypothetical protein PLU35_13815 [Phycisphaerales bacterium]|nr:hypothetical protein [Phycisphaerales bacterium]
MAAQSLNIHPHHRTPHDLIAPHSTGVTIGQHARLLAPVMIDFGDGVPDAPDVPDLLDRLDPDDGPTGPQTDLDEGLVVWQPRPQKLQAVRFVLDPGEEEGTVVADVLLGGYRELLRKTADGQYRKQRIVHLFDLLKISATDAAHVGVEDGLVTDAQRYADTIEVVTTYRAQPNPERLLGPKDVSDALAPDGSAVDLLYDAMGCTHLFAYLSCSAAGEDVAAAGVNIIEWPLSD